MSGTSLADLLRRTAEVRGDEIFYRFGNGLRLKAEILAKNDPLRILPLGNPQGALMNHMANFPDLVRGKRVFEPFAGSGPLGFMALALGARHVDFLDLNPRAPELQRYNAGLNQIGPDRVAFLEGDIATFVPGAKYDLLVANPPFVPTPDGMPGTLTSNGGPEGNRLVEILLARLDALLEPGGEALIYLFQLVAGGRPLVADRMAKRLIGRSVELTPSQARQIPFELYLRAYEQRFPEARAAIERWASALIGDHGEELTLCHYVAHVGARRDGPTSIEIRDDFAEKFGASFLVPSDDRERLAVARVAENFLPGAD